LSQIFATAEPAVAGCKLKKVYEGESHVSLPVFFATDRAQVVTTKKDLDYKKQIIYPLDAISYGFKRMDSTCTLPDNMEYLSKCGWLVYPVGIKQKDREGFVLESNCEVSHAISSFDEMVARVKGNLEASPKKEIVIYVHGCCLNFQESMQQAADLASSVKVPVIAYSWGCSLGYAGSNMAYPRTQERFNKFLVQMLTAFPKEKISVVSSSIGTQLVYNFCLQRRPEDYGNRGIDELIFSRADLDDVVFKSQLESIVRHSKKLIVYVSKNDFQINVSGTLRWFFFPTQHGERAGHLRAGLQIEPSLTVLDVSPLRMGHVIPYESVADILEHNGEVPTDTRLYQYRHEEDNLYRVHPQKNMFEHSASKPSKSKRRACKGCQDRLSKGVLISR
jgi:esterase/lipase superfamily enzyme